MLERRSLFQDWQPQRVGSVVNQDSGNEPGCLYDHPRSLIAAGYSVVIRMFSP
jgi:hypothetical protein